MLRDQRVGREVEEYEPLQAPNANAHAERLVRSIKEECLDRMISLGAAPLPPTVTEFVDHYHRERNHEGLGNRLIDDAPRKRADRICRRPRLGELPNCYERAI